MKAMLVWWFYPKKRVSSVIKMLIGALIAFTFASSLVGNSLDLIDAFRNPPLFVGVSHLVLPAISELLSAGILWAALFYLPYCILGSKKRYWIRISLAVLTIGIVFSVGALSEYIAPYYPTLEAKELTAAQAKLGKMDKQGRFYTLREFGYDIARLTKFPPDYTIPRPDYMITQAEGYPELVIFYRESEALWAEYDKLPYDMEFAIVSVAERLYRTDDYYLAGILWSLYDELPSAPTSMRTKYRSNHPEVEASLLFWGKVARPASGMKASDREMTMELLLKWFDHYGIDKRMHPRFANWSLLTEEEWLDWVKKYLK